MPKGFIKLAVTTTLSAYALGALSVVVMSAYMRSQGVEPPPLDVLVYSVPAAIVFGLVGAWVATANKRFNLTRRAQVARMGKRRAG